MHAFLVVSATIDQRLRMTEEILDSEGVANGPNDRYLVSPSTASIGIDAVRGAQAWIGQSASRRRACVILDADRLTLVAQHAILKTIEEPPSEQTIFVMSVSSEHALLPTLRSRCVIRRAKPPRGVLPAGPFRVPRTELLVRASADREHIGRVFDQLIQRAHQTLVSSSSPKTPLPSVLRAALNADARLKAQCNTTSVVRRFLLDIPITP